MRRQIAFTLFIVGALATISVFAFHVANPFRSVTQDANDKPSANTARILNSEEQQPAMAETALQRGMITGRVVDDRAQPVAGARVSPVRIGVSLAYGAPIVKTNGSGEFKIIAAPLIG